MKRARIQALRIFPVTGILALMLFQSLEFRAAAENYFSNPGFEIVGPGSDEWHMDRGGKTEAEFRIERKDAADGDHSALVHIGSVSDWGVQFGQSVAAGAKGKTYTFSVLAKSIGKPVTVNLEIERRAKPYDRAAKGGPFTIMPDKWTELHTTFTLEKDFPQGWFAYISCTQPDCEFRADIFRLCKGEFVPFAKLAHEDDAATGIHLTQTADTLSVSNNYLALTVRKGARAAEVQCPATKGPAIVPIARKDDDSKTITGFTVIENTAAKAQIEIQSVSASGGRLATRFLIRKNKPTIEVSAGDGMEGLLVESPGRYAIVPDIFAGDLVVNPVAIQQTSLRIPNEKLVATLTDDGNSIVVCSWRSDAQSARLRIDKGSIAGTEIECRKDSPVTVATLAGPAIWCRKKTSELDPVKDTKLDWQVPFRALWRTDFRREDGLIDSWKMPVRKSESEWDGFGVSFNKPKTRTVWTSARETFAYPVCIVGNDAFLRRTKFEQPEGLKYRDDDFAIIYPFQKVNGSPPDAWGVFDVLRETLAGTPQEKILDDLVVKRVPRDRYPATCAVTAEYEGVFGDGEEKAKKKLLLERLDAMDNFVLGIRSRIDEYQAWRKKTGDFIAQQKASQPQLVAFADEFSGVLAKFEKRSDALKLAERNPKAAKKLIAQVVTLIDSSETNKAEIAKQIGRDTRTVGGSQDHAIGDFRFITKELRQRAGYRMLEAKTDAESEFARTIRERTLEMLDHAFGHEGASTD